jgi:hypothetical protein
MSEAEGKIFETEDDLINDEVFKQYVEIELEKLKKKRRIRPEPKPGWRYKRDWYDRYIGKDVLNSKFFLSNIKSIWEKKSDLSSELRGIISYVCSLAIVDTDIHYKKEKN